MTTLTTERKLEVYLIVDHPILSSSELSRILTLPADECWDVGQKYKPAPTSSQQHYQFSRWALRSVADSLNDLPRAINVLTSRIRGIEQKFLLLPSDSTISLTLFATEIDTVIGMGIDVETVNLLARIHACIEVSLVVTSGNGQQK